MNMNALDLDLIRDGAPARRLMRDQALAAMRALGFDREIAA